MDYQEIAHLIFSFWDQIWRNPSGQRQNLACCSNVTPLSHCDPQMNDPELPLAILDSVQHKINKPTCCESPTYCSGAGLQLGHAMHSKNESLKVISFKHITRHICQLHSLSLQPEAPFWGPLVGRHNECGFSERTKALWPQHTNNCGAGGMGPFWYLKHNTKHPTLR